MSTLGKIVTVFVVIAAVTVAVMVATFVKMSDDWKRDALLAEEVVKKQGKAVDTFKSALGARNNTIAENARTHQLKVNALNSDIARLGQDKKDLEDKLRVETNARALGDTTVAGLKTSVQTILTEKNNLATERDKAVARVKELLDANMKLTKTARDQRRQIADLRDRSRALAEQNTELSKQLAYLREIWPGGEVPTGTVPTLPATDLAGRVKGVRGASAEINLGASDKVVEGMTFIVSRGNRYLADLVITSVDENSAVGELKTTQGRQVQEDDHVTYTVRR